jgi:uncharacterized protein YggE
MNRMIAAAAAMSIFAASPLAAQPGLADRGPIITVRGDGRAEVPPDIARLTAEVVTKARTLQGATDAHRTRATQAANALKSMAKDGVEIEQSGFRLDQVRQPPQPQGGGARPETEYQAVTSFQIRIKTLAQVDAAITAIASTGLFEVHNLRFGLDEKNGALDTARRNAVADARNRAKLYAEAAGVALGEVIEITDSEPRMFREVAAAPMAARSVQVAPPENIAVTAGITMTWRIRQP